MGPPNNSMVCYMNKPPQSTHIVLNPTLTAGYHNCDPAIVPISTANTHLAEGVAAVTAVILAGAGIYACQQYSGESSSEDAPYHQLLMENCREDRDTTEVTYGF